MFKYTLQLWIIISMALLGTVACAPDQEKETPPEAESPEDTETQQPAAIKKAQVESLKRAIAAAKAQHTKVPAAHQSLVALIGPSTLANPAVIDAWGETGGPLSNKTWSSDETTSSLDCLISISRLFDELAKKDLPPDFDEEKAAGVIAQWTKAAGGSLGKLKEAAKTVLRLLRPISIKGSKTQQGERAKDCGSILVGESVGKFTSRDAVFITGEQAGLGKKQGNGSGNIGSSAADRKAPYQIPYAEAKLLTAYLEALVAFAQYST